MTLLISAFWVFIIPKGSAQSDSVKSPYSFKDFKYFEKGENTFDFKNSPNFSEKYEYDPIHKTYTQKKFIGNTEIGDPKPKSFKKFIEEKSKERERAYFREKAKAENFVRSSGILPKIYLSPPIFDKIFGGGLIDIRPTGSAELTFGGNFNTVRNPQFSQRQQQNGQFDFETKLQLGINGQIGNKVKVNWNYDTEATFDFENQMKLNWQGEEDDILKNIELGNVALPLNGSLIKGGQSLFGIKTKMQFGRLNVTTILTQQQGETKETQLNGGAQVTEFNIQAHQYEANRHFFLGQFFRDQYNNALSLLPVVQSNILINYIEVWVTNRSRSFNTNRDLIAYMDLGEFDPYNASLKDAGKSNDVPDNKTNLLYDRVLSNPNYRQINSALNQWNNSNVPMRVGQDITLLSNARLLNKNEYTINDRLGYISLNNSLNNDEVLAVAYDFTYNGVRYQVGEFTRDNPATVENPSALTVKMLKGTLTKTNLPIWDLMMKNVYSLGSMGIQANDFRLNVVYADDPSGADLNYLPVKSEESQIHQKTLIDVLNLDNINRQNEAKPDGVFDFISGLTINTQTGRIIFPVLEPFGDHLRSKFIDPQGKQADYYAFGSLYDSTQWLAEQDVQHNKFFLRGSYRGTSTNEISLNSINVPRGSVRVTANGSLLQEGSDYIVDYTLGKVKIINEGILNSGASINVSSESNTLFNVQQKSLMGTRLDYQHSDKLFLGGTFMHMSERPLTPKVNIGEETILNSIWGGDIAYSTESRFLTKLVDKLPFIETKEKSSVNFTGEFAQIIPHKPRSMGERGTSYIDDFEGAEIPFDLKFWNNWKLASTPQGQNDLFPETSLDSTYNHHRAKLAWYSIDPVYQSVQNLTPDHLKDDPNQRSNHNVRSVAQTEIFPELNLQQGQPRQQATLDLAFYPKLRGQYNYNAGILDNEGKIIETQIEKSWGGITRRIETNDFQAANIDYIEVWVMDPFANDINKNSQTKGFLYINLGSVSEDVLPDQQKSYENGLPKDDNNENVDFTTFGRISTLPAINNAFDNDPAARPFQDVGYDGLSDAAEQDYFKPFLNQIEQSHGTASKAYQQALSDPSADNYVHHRDETYDNNQSSILKRYQTFNGLEGNSSLSKLPNGIPKSNSVSPDDEDINNDFTLSLNEEYFQYKIEISRDAFKVGQNYITDSVRVRPNLPAKIQPEEVTYYQLKIPIREYEKAVNGIQDFKSIRFMRMFMHGFNDSIILRFAQLQLVRADWRRYLEGLKYPPSVGPSPDQDEDVEFVISTVNIVENSRREPVAYVVPPDFQRELDPTQPNTVQQNEQSLSLAVCGLKKGDARAAYKTNQLDIRNYKNLKMFIHAEGEDLKNGDVHAFMRMGTDLQNNYYEYEIPLQITPFGAQSDADIWPDANRLEVELEIFNALKLERQNFTQDPLAFFEKKLPNGHIVRVKGLPDLSNIRSMMLGIRNPAEKTDGQENLCAEVWFNEMRLTDFTNKGGYAANARLVANLADFATINANGNYESIGFGGVDKTLNERSIDETIQYDLSSTFELGKFFPQKLGITIPMYLGWGETFVNPKFYPLNPDVLLRTAIKNASDETEKKKIREAAQDYTSRYSINFTNVKKNRVNGGKSHIWDIENFNFSYAYQKIYRRNQVIEENIERIYRASIGYNYSSNAKPWQPLKNKIKSRKLAIIRDFNISFLPQSLSFRTDVDRRYSELQNRNNDQFQAIVPRFFDKTFRINRTYAMRWNLTRSLKFDYAATANAWVEEPTGALNSQAKKDSVKNNLLNFGKLNDFNQTINLNYTLPFTKIRKLSWINTTARYSGSYNWRLASPRAPYLGNTLQNSQSYSVNSTMNFTSFYNMFPALRKLNQKSRAKSKKEKDKVSFNTLGKMLIMLKQAQFSYTINRGTTLPGFKENIDLFGQNFLKQSPGWDFVMGEQKEQIRYDLARQGYLSSSPVQNNLYIETITEDLTGRATLEPLSGFRISLDFNKRKSQNTQSMFRVDTTNNYNDFRDIGLNHSGTFSMSTIMWRSTFESLDEELWTTSTYNQFLNNRFVIAQRLQAVQFTTVDAYKSSGFDQQVGVLDDSTGFPAGFNKNHPDVLLYSFLAAYNGQNAINTKFNPFPAIPLPNWRINYNGLNKLLGIEKKVTNLNISHAYSANYSVGSYLSSLDFGSEDILERGNNLTPFYQYQGGVTLVERITPLLGVDLTFKSGLTIKFETKRNRNLNLNLNNAQMVEQRNKEWVLGVGFRSTRIRIPLNFQGKRLKLDNDLNFRMDVSVRDGVTIVRKIDSDVNTPTAGNRLVSIKPTLDYLLNKNLNLRAFYNRTVNEPRTTYSFPTALTNFGLTLRYTLQ